MLIKEMYVWIIYILNHRKELVKQHCFKFTILHIDFIDILLNINRTKTYKI